MLKSLIQILAFSSFLFAQSIPSPSIEFSPRKYVCYKSGEDLNIDGKLVEASWSKTEWTDDFLDIEGLQKPIPALRTRAKMLWDDNYFYIAAELTEPDIWGNLVNRDDIIFYDNDFEVFIDPDGDTHRYCEFEMNALNTVWDLFLVLPYRDTKNAAIHGWDIKGLKTGVAIEGTINKPGDTDKFWTVEIAFPWAAFKEISETPAPPQNNDQWRVNFSRVEWKIETIDGKYKKQINTLTNKPFPEDNWVWSPQGVVNMHYPEMWGYVQFSTKAPGSEKENFIENKNEAVKWFLRQIYYKQKTYLEKNGVFADKFELLGIKNQSIPGFIMKPVIESTANMFEASISSDDGTKKISIRNDGLVWISEVKK